MRAVNVSFACKADTSSPEAKPIETGFQQALRLDHA